MKKGKQITVANILEYEKKKMKLYIDDYNKENVQFRLVLNSRTNEKSYPILNITYTLYLTNKKRTLTTVSFTRLKTGFRFKSEVLTIFKPSE